MTEDTNNNTTITKLGNEKADAAEDDDKLSDVAATFREMLNQDFNKFCKLEIELFKNDCSDVKLFINNKAK